MPSRLRTRALPCLLAAFMCCGAGWGIADAADHIGAAQHPKAKRHKPRGHKHKHHHRRHRLHRHKRHKRTDHAAQSRHVTPPRNTGGGTPGQRHGTPAAHNSGTPTTQHSTTTGIGGAAPQDPPGTPTVGPNDVVTPFPAGARLFAPDSVWNAAVPADAALDPSSGRLVSALANEVRAEVAAVHGPWINTNSWSIADYTVGANVPTAHVTLDTTMPSLQSDFDAVPLPTGAQAAPGNGGSLGDGSLVIYQPATDTLWEFWLLQHEADGWHARWGGKMTHVSANPGFFSSPYGGSGTSLALMGGLMTIHELEAQRIDHALAIAIPNTATNFTWPAQRGDGHTVGSTAIPEGTRFRIDPSLDLTKLGMTPLGLAIARAVQKYGMIVRDTSGNVAFYAEDPGPLGNDPYGQIFGGLYPDKVIAGFPWDRLQVVAPQPR